MKVDTWDYVTLLRKWLDTDAAPTTLEDARLLRVLKISEELGAEALHGVLGANPRKGASHGWGDVAKERGRHRDGHDRAGHGQRGRRGCGEAAAPGPHGGRADSGRGYRPGPRDQRGHEAGRHRRVRGAGHGPRGEATEVTHTWEDVEARLGRLVRTAAAVLDDLTGDAWDTLDDRLRFPRGEGRGLERIFVSVRGS